MPTFTPFLPRRQFLPRQAFYPNFTPFAILCALRLPRFYPWGKTAHFLLVRESAGGASCDMRQETAVKQSAVLPSIFGCCCWKKGGVRYVPDLPSESFLQQIQLDDSTAAHA